MLPLFFGENFSRVQSILTCAYYDRKRFDWCRVECVVEFRRRRKDLALDVPCGKTKSQRSFGEWIRVEDEAAGADGAHLHWSVSAVAQWQRVEQMGRLAKVHAGEQREIVRRLQQPEMIEDCALARLIPPETLIKRDLRAQQNLKRFLAFQKLIEQGHLCGLDCRSVGTFAEQVVGMHGNQKRCVSIFGGDFTNRAIAHSQKIRKIDFLET